MPRVSPTLEGFRAAFRRPSLTFAEIAWRWSFGAAAVALFAFALLEYFKGHARNELAHPKWDPRKLPKADPLADRNGPRHPYADVFASAIFLAWTDLWNLLPVGLALTVVWCWFSIDARRHIGCL